MQVDIVPIGDVPVANINAAVSALESIYDCDATIIDQQDFPENAYDQPRDQYEAGVIIDYVSELGDGDYTLGITEHDLFFRRRNYIFGLAYLGGGGSIISTHRLKIVPDGGITTQPEDEIAAARIRKEAVHEVGHTLGLEHCDNARCVMNFSPTVREVDIKEETLCGSCSREIT